MNLSGTRKRLGTGIASLALGGGMLGVAPAAVAADSSPAARDGVQAAACEPGNIKLSGARFSYEECATGKGNYVSGTLTDKAADGECAYLNVSWANGKTFAKKVCGNEKSIDVKSPAHKGNAKVRLSER